MLNVCIIGGLELNRMNYIPLLCSFLKRMAHGTPVESASSHMRFYRSFETEVEKSSVLFSEPGKQNTFTSNPLKKQPFSFGDYSSLFPNTAK